MSEGSESDLATRDSLHVTQERIQARAYEIYLARSGIAGDALADWVQAEREITGESNGAMSSSIATLLTRNLHDVFGEADPIRRRAAIDELFTEDCVFHEPKGVYRGRDEIDRIAGTIRASHPDFRYHPIAEPEELNNCGRIQWVSGRPGDEPAYAGTDFIIARGGRIAFVYLFFDKLPGPGRQDAADVLTEPGPGAPRRG
jgi:hypothetical protein